MSSQSNTCTVTYSQSIARVFRGTRYSVSARVDGDVLHIVVEDLDTAERWLGDFASHALEEMTYKTGNLKKFPTFVKMLAVALAGESSSVLADVLTAADLDELRVRKTGQSAPAHSGDGPGKRYLIVSYTAEFDHVHYPLPLKHEATPDVARLKGLICALRAELDSNKGTSSRASTGACSQCAAVREERDTRVAEAAAARREAERAVAECAGLEDALGRAARENKKLRQLVRAISLDNQEALRKVTLPPGDATAAEVYDLKLRLAAAVDAVSALGAGGGAVARLEAEVARLEGALAEERARFRAEVQALEEDQAALVSELERRLRREGVQEEEEEGARRDERVERGSVGPDAGAWSREGVWADEESLREHSRVNSHNGQGKGRTGRAGGSAASRLYAHDTAASARRLRSRSPSPAALRIGSSPAPRAYPPPLPPTRHAAPYALPRNSSRPPSRPSSRPPSRPSSASRSRPPSVGRGGRPSESLSFRPPPRPPAKGSGHGGIPSFDPSAYIAQRRAQREAALQRDGRADSRSLTRDSSNGRLRSRTPSPATRGLSTTISTSSFRAGVYDHMNQRATTPRARPTSGTGSFTKVTPKKDGLVADIDERLKELQEYLRKHN